MKTKTVILVLALTLSSSVSFALDLSLAVTAGANLFGNIDGDVTVLGDTASAGYSSAIKPTAGLELRAGLTPNLFASFTSNWSVMMPSDGTASNTLMSFMIMPGVQTTTGSVNLWGGFGLGMGNTRVANTAISSGGLTMVLNSGNSMGLAIAPRAGVNFFITPSLALGAMAAYTIQSASYSGTVSDGTNSAALSLGYSFRAFSLGTVLTYRLGE